MERLQARRPPPVLEGDEYESYDEDEDEDEEDEDELPHLERADTTDDEGAAADGAAAADSATGDAGAGRCEAAAAEEAAEVAAAQAAAEEPEMLTDVLGVALRLPHRRW